MTQILVLGGAVYATMIYLDHFPEPRGQTLFSTGNHTTAGGTGAGKALNLKRLGFDVTLHALIGDDAPGAFLRETFQRAGVMLAAEIDPAGTERHVNLMAASGERISIYVNYATFRPEIDMARLEQHISRADIVVMNIINYCRAAIPLVKAQGKDIWCDIHNYDGQETYHQDFIAAADYLFMSSEQMPDYRAFMQAQIASGKKLVVCTHGKDGATALTPAGEWIEVAAEAVEAVVDTNGAGDSFFAGTLYGLHHGHDIAASLRMGAKAAALCVSARELFSPQLSPAALA